MVYDNNIRGQKGLMKDKYPDAFEGNSLTVKAYQNQNLVEQGEISENQKVSVFVGSDKESRLKAYNIAKEAVKVNASVNLYWRPEWFPEINGSSYDAENSFKLEISSEKDLRRLKNNTINWEMCTFSDVKDSDISYLTTTYWNRDLDNINELTNKTIGYLGHIANHDDFEQKYTMERYLIEGVDEFRTSDPHNRMILKQRHLGLNKEINYSFEKDSLLKGKKILFVPEMPLKEGMVGRWRHEWPAEYLGDYGIDYRVQGLFTRVLEKEDGIWEWSKKIKAEAKRMGVTFDDYFISQKIFKNLKKYVDDADVVIFGRTNNKWGKIVFDYCKKTEKVIGYDVDDNIFGFNPIKEYSKPIDDDSSGKSMADYINEQIRASDFVTVSSKNLAKIASDLRNSSNDVFVMKNRMDLEEILYEDKKPSDQVRIGWAGGPSHIDNLTNLGPMFKKLYEEHRDKIKFVVKGIDRTLLRQNGEEGKLEDFLRTVEGLPFEFHGYTKQDLWQKYYKDLHDLNLDIFISPGKDDEEYYGKSELKYLEGTVAGAAVVAEDLGSFPDVIKHGVNGFLVRHGDIDNFYNCVNFLVNDWGLREALQKRAINHIKRNHHVKKSSKQLYDILRRYVK